MAVTLVVALVVLALVCSYHPVLRRVAFTAWVLVFVAVSMVWPEAFGAWFGYDLKGLIVPLIQIIMFGMGTTLSVADFTRVLTMPWPVVVGVVLQYSIMPFVGLGLATLFGFEAEIAAGVILIGSVPGGVASNVISYLARCNVPLSVTMTAISTLLSPLMTPLMMKLLAGRHVEVDFLKMMLDICNMIVVPIVAGLIANRLLYGREPWLQQKRWLASIAAAGVALAIALALLPAGFLGPLRTGLILGISLVGIAVAAKLVVEHLFHGSRNWMDRALPIVSMAAICYIIGIITARSAEDLKRVGAALLAAAAMHNLAGYVLGYWAARALRFNLVDARTVAIEVGMQNGGMASGLAMNTLQSAKVALAAAIFGPWMNVSGSILAGWWRRRPVPGTEPAVNHDKP